jgi:hypothetical protein
MLKRPELERLENILHKEIATRQALGGYSPEAGTILTLCQISFELLRHIRETLPGPKPKQRKTHE